MSLLALDTIRRSNTRYILTDAWDAAFRDWFCKHDDSGRCKHLAVLSDERVWALHGERVCRSLAPLTRQIFALTLPPGEASKEFSRLTGLVDCLVANHFGRQDLLIIVGGGVCCDLGGLLAQLFMRGVDYVNVPTSLMAQIDAAIGGKVGVNVGMRKNLLGGFHHPRLVLLDPGFLDTLPQEHFRTALSEAVKLAIIRKDDTLLSLLSDGAPELLARKRSAVTELVERCLRGKLDLLENDPYESELNRSLNLGHAMAHVLELLPVLPPARAPYHGEAVAMGLAITIRFAFRKGYCSRERANRLLGVLHGLELPLSPHNIDRARVRESLKCIPEHRGGLLRLVIPLEEGIRILPEAEIEDLLDCVYPIAGLAL